MSWTDGYVSDIEYTSHYYLEMAPPHLDFAALTAGVLPPDREDGHFRYCELGCGNGMTTNLLAACHPKAEFVGIDFMPVHIANSRKMAKKAGLHNVKFLELSFADACSEELGQFDYIVAHGIYSWVSPENRAEMVAFYRRFLAPGGLVYLSYNTYPGWSAIAPVQKVVSEYAKTLHGPSPQRARRGFEFAAQLLEKNAGTFQVFPGAKQQIEKAPTQPANYLAHEYLNEAWYPLYVTDVMREMAGAKLEYVASATLSENDTRYMVSEDLAVLIRDQPTEELRQLVKDISINARFRRDVYSRGGRRLSGLDQRQLIGERRVALTVSAEAVTYQTEVMGRKIAFDTSTGRTVVAALSETPKTVAELVARCQESGDVLRSVLDVIIVLCVSRQAQLVDAPQDAGVNINRVISGTALEDATCNALASGFGAGIPVLPLEIAMLTTPDNFKSVEAGVKFMKTLAAKKGRVFNRGGKPIGSEKEVDEFLIEEVSGVYKKRAGVFKQLGLLPADLKIGDTQ